MDSYKLLCLAIIQRAANDYLHSIGKIKLPYSIKFKGVKTDSSEDLRRFFLSDWFELINPLGVSGADILKRLDEGEFTEAIEFA